MSRRRIGLLAVGLAMLGATLNGSRSAPAAATGAAAPARAIAPVMAAATTPIKNVVFILQENHSFDNVLGLWCAQTGRCDGATTGKLATGATIPLGPARDKVINVIHSGQAQVKAINNGAMDGYSLLKGCGSKNNYPCYTQYVPPTPQAPGSISNVIALASTYAVSDQTFEADPVQSWGAHLEAVAATLDGTTGGEPGGGTRNAPGWGCDSGKDVRWTDPSGNQFIVPSCIPKPDGSGPYRASPVPWVPTIMDRLDAAGVGWKLYTGLRGTGNSTGYGWAMCPSFADCLYTSQSQHMVDSAQILNDAAAGTLPSFSIVTPNQANSQHNGRSMAVGDNWIGQVVGAIENGPQSGSTAIFISWDDCGCFYDHVNPPNGFGIRVPMIIVSPYAKAGYTDSVPASFASVLAFTETVFGLPNLGGKDAGAYNYMGAFDFTKQSKATFKPTTTVVPWSELSDIAANPPDPDDPT